MTTALSSQLRIVLCVFLAAASGFTETAAPSFPSGFIPSSPLGSIRSLTELPQRLLSGGGWLAGLPGRPPYNGTHVHAGIDLAAPLGDPVHAIVPGPLARSFGIQ